MTSLTIGTLAKQAGVGVETVRFYERRGLVRRPAKPTAGFRSYPKEAVTRIRFIRNAQWLGFSLQEIKDLLALRPSTRTSCAAVRSRAAAKAADVEKRLAELDRIQSALRTLLSACPGRGTLIYCTIMEALELPDLGGGHRR